VADAATQVEAPPYQLEVLTIDVPDATSPEEQFCALPRDQFVDQALAVSRAPARASFPGDEPVTVGLVLEGSKLKVTGDGWVIDGQGRMALDELLVDVWSASGWSVFDTVRAQLDAVASRRDVDQQVVAAAVSAHALVDASRAALASQVTEFLTTLEANMLSTLVAELEKAQALAKSIRRRYLEDPPPPTGPSELKRLRDDVDVLLGVHVALLEHERFYAQLFGPLKGVAAAKRLAFPFTIESLLPPPPPDALRETFGPILGAMLEEWFAEEITDYRMGRDRLLRATAAYLASARKRHPILVHLWSRFAATPTEEQLKVEIAKVCDDVVDASTAALEEIADDQGYRLLLQHVVVVKSVPHENLSDEKGDVRSGSVAEHLGLATAADPLGAVAELMSQRDSTLGRMSGDLATWVNAVTVWDLDELRATTLAEMGEQVGPVEQAALNLLDGMLLRATLGTVAKDFAAQVALSLVLAPTGASLAVNALLGVVDGIHELSSYWDRQLLARSELLAASKEVRRIMSYDPSVVPLFVAVVGIVGDAAAIARLPRLVRALNRLNLLVLLGTAGPDLVAVLAKVALAHDDAEAKARKP
jgi:hypothetical protein